MKDILSNIKDETLQKYLRIGFKILKYIIAVNIIFFVIYFFAIKAIIEKVVPQEDFDKAGQFVNTMLSDEQEKANMAIETQAVYWLYNQDVSGYIASHTDCKINPKCVKYYDITKGGVK